ncbi:hypothetical protein MKZ38_005739 [Zalerion maritima]|uniref:Major facilitator superfamily (MFS) profile domain-containing protein n=1 Tax=Zalerion maritima TaxID=339359 RepID=A0AAD5RJT3_9PEZI|nr:hypothetical protein MKZ38_005739 [Zalerion maritima]
MGRLSDITSKKYLAAVPPLIAFAGAVVSAKATSMSMLIAGSILIGVTLSTISIAQAIPSEVLPLKYRALAQGLCGMAGTIGGLVGSLGGGAVTNVASDGWRWIFWMQAIFHGITSVGFFLFYWPRANTEYPNITLKEIVWICDPIGSVLFILGATLTLLAMDWASGTYDGSDPHIVAPLTIGLVILAAFCAYEWKGRADGLVAHVFFRRNANFALAVFAYAVEGWIFYSAVNSVVPQIVLYLGWEDDSWDISVRQLSFQLVIFFTPILLSWYATRFKDLKSPLLVTWISFLAVSIFYSCVKPSLDKGQIVINVVGGFGQAGPLTLLPAVIQYTAPHAFLSTATGLAFSARAIGGAFGSAVLDAIINGRINAHYASAVSGAAIDAGLPQSSVEALLEAIANSLTRESVPGATEDVWNAALDASHNEYAHAFRLAWASVIPFVVLALIALAFLKGVKELMTEKVEATVEKLKVELDEDTEKGVGSKIAEMHL